MTEQPATLEPTYSPKVFAENRGLSQHTVLRWIHSGELRAVDVSDPKSRRRKYRIPLSAIQEFDDARRVVPKTEAETRPRRKAKAVGRDFFS